MTSRRNWTKTDDKIRATVNVLTILTSNGLSATQYDNACFVLIHVDDILVVGQRDYVLNQFVPCLENKYEISTQVIAKPGDELHFLKRRMTLLSDSRLLIQTHHKHVQQMCDVLGLNKALQRKKSPGHAEMDQCDLSGEISPQDAVLELDRFCSLA